MSSIDKYDDDNDNVNLNEEENNANVNDNENEDVEINEEHAHYQPKKESGDDDTVKYQLSGMYQNWFWD